MADNSAGPTVTLLASAIVGALTGVLCSIMRMLIGLLERLRFDWLMAHDWTSTILMILTSGLLSSVAVFLVFKFAPETKGSGIPEVEGCIEDVRSARWWRIIPVKLVGSICAVSSAMVLGHGGPSVQIGAGTGQMVHDLFHLRNKGTQHILMVCGTAAGMASAFNAPMAGIMFVVAEEMLPNFHYSFVSFKAVIIATITAIITSQLLQGNRPVLSVPSLDDAPFSVIPILIILGTLSGAAGVLFNHAIMITRHAFVLMHHNEPVSYLSLIACLGGGVGLLLSVFPAVVLDGSALLIDLTHDAFSLTTLMTWFFLRFVTTLLCFGCGAPGGMMMPALALGGLMGCIMAGACQSLVSVEPATLCLAGMAAFFAATVRAPITAILLVMEITLDYNLLLPLLITTMSAVIVAQSMGGGPIDHWLLQQTQALEQAIEERKTGERKTGNR